MKKIFTLLFCLSLLPLVASATDDKPIEFSQLPKEAQAFVTTHFSQAQIAFAKMDRDLFSRDYEVIFTDGSQLSFNSKGQWTKVSCEKSSTFTVPSAIIPQAIADKVKSKWPASRITEIEKSERGRIDISLDNRMELTFDAHFNIVEYDD